MKRLFAVFSLLLCCMLCCAPVATAESVSDSSAEPVHPPRLVDTAGLLSESESSELEAKLNEISERQQFDVVVLTVTSTGGRSIMNFADDFYDYYGYGYGDNADGVILVVDMGEREWWISTCGYGITAITDYGREYIENEFVSYLSYGDYFRGFEVYADLCDELVTQARAGKPYDISGESRKSVSLMWIPGSLLLGAIPAFIVCSSLKGQLKTVRAKTNADSYVDRSLSKTTRRNDIFLYRNVTRTRIVHDNGGMGGGSRGGGGSHTHHSSSGRSHGGGGGHF